jgi:lipopolysaccharide/colanic/teichoic acid biosynthesis glycosyltransferase
MDNRITYFAKLEDRPQTFAYRTGFRIAKRVMDLAFCLLALPLILPLMALCALLIILDSPGPALFVQERIGRGGRRFRMYKFRTMQHNLDRSPHRAFMKAFVRGEVREEADISHVEDDQDSDFYDAVMKPFVNVKPGSNGNGTIFKPACSSQITRVGRFLRKISLDELPQVINVLKGEMSLVGPRPNVPWEVEEYQPWHYQRLAALPGITGLAQVKGRSSISFDRIVKYDIEYIEKQSPMWDFKILWWTLSTVLLGTDTE